MKKIKDVRAYVLRSDNQGADYHARAGAHWINKTVIATPMSVYPEYQQTRTSFGIDVLGSLMVEVEAEDGTIGFSVTTGGFPGAYLVEKHFSRFIVGQLCNNVELMFDQMYKASMYYGRKGLTLNAISAVDCAVWDLLGNIRQEPVWAMIGGKMRDRQPMYATGPRPDLAKEMGFVGGKIPLPYGPAHGREGLRKNLELAAEMREKCGSDFMLAFDCWMALDKAYTLQLIRELEAYDFHWIEEALPPDDFEGYADLVKQRSFPIRITTGEHEYSRWGFKNLLDTGVDIIQPDVNWCGGLTELLKIKAMASARNRLVIPHGSGTVAMITSAGIMAALIESITLSYHPIYIYLAIGYGSMTLSWMNDSAFWVISKLSGFDEKEMLKSWTPTLAMMSVLGLLQALLMSWMIP